MSADTCAWCSSLDVVLTDPDGDGCCAHDRPLLDPDAVCDFCAMTDPVKMVSGRRCCISCLNAFQEAGVLRRDPGRGQHYRVAAVVGEVMTFRENIERLAREVGIADPWSLSLADFAWRVAEARCMKLGLVKARGVDVTLQVTANEVSR